MTSEEVKKIHINFIVCGPRTGSTLLSSMLNMHPEVISPVEEPFSYNLYFKYHNVKKWTRSVIDDYCKDFFLFSGNLLSFQFGTKNELKERLLKHEKALDFNLVVRLTYLCFIPLKHKKGITTIVDKQIKMSNYLLQASTMYPEAKFVLLYRNPLDNIPRRKRMLDNGYKKKRKQSFMYNALNWNYDYSLLMRDKEKISPDRILEVKYEDLILDPKTQLQKICNFLAIPYSDQLLEYDEIYKKSFEKLSSEYDISSYLLSHLGLTQKPLPSKIGAWKKELDPADANVIWDICGKTAEKMGYTRDPSIASVSRGLPYYLRYTKLLILKYSIQHLWISLPFSVQALLKKMKYGKSKFNYVPLFHSSATTANANK